MRVLSCFVEFLKTSCRAKMKLMHKFVANLALIVLLLICDYIYVVMLWRKTVNLREFYLNNILVVFGAVSGYSVASLLGMYNKEHSKG